MITEQVIYICIFSSVFDTPSRLLRSLAFKAAIYCLVCNPHRLSFRASSVEAEVWWGKKERVKGKRRKWKREFFTQCTRKRHSICKRHPCFDHSVLIWTAALRLWLFNLPSHQFSHRLQIIFYHPTFWQLFPHCNTVVCFIKSYNSELQTAPESRYLCCLHSS